MNKAIYIATGIPGLSFSIGEDGVWMNTSGDGKHTCINLSNLAKEDKKGLNTGLLNWCKEVDVKYRRTCETCIEAPDAGSCPHCGDSIITTKDGWKPKE